MMNVSINTTKGREKNEEIGKREWENPRLQEVKWVWGGSIAKRRKEKGGGRTRAIFILILYLVARKKKKKKK